MNERQKRRREWARATAKATGRAWQTGDSHRLAVRVNRIEASQRRWHPPLIWRQPVGYRLPDTGSIADQEDAGMAFERRAARQSAIWQPVKHVDTPVPPVGTFRLRDI